MVVREQDLETGKFLGKYSCEIVHWPGLVNSNMDRSKALSPERVVVYNCGVGLKILALSYGQDECELTTQYGITANKKYTLRVGVPFATQFMPTKINGEPRYVPVTGLFLSLGLRYTRDIYDQKVKTEFYKDRNRVADAIANLLGPAVAARYSHGLVGLL